MPLLGMGEERGLSKTPLLKVLGLVPAREGIVRLPLSLLRGQHPRLTFAALRKDFSQSGFAVALGMRQPESLVHDYGQKCSFESTFAPVDSRRSVAITGNLLQGNAFEISIPQMTHGAWKGPF